MKQKLFLVLLGLLFLNLGPLCRIASAQTSSVTISSLTNGQTVSGHNVDVYANYTIAPGYQTNDGGEMYWTSSSGVVWNWETHTPVSEGSGICGAMCDSTYIPNGVYTIVIVMPCGNTPATAGHWTYIQSPPITVNVQN